MKEGIDLIGDLKSYENLSNIAEELKQIRFYFDKYGSELVSISKSLKEISEK